MYLFFLFYFSRRKATSNCLPKFPNWYVLRKDYFEVISTILFTFSNFDRFRYTGHFLCKTIREVHFLIVVFRQPFPETTRGFEKKNAIRHRKSGVRVIQNHIPGLIQQFHEWLRNYPFHEFRQVHPIRSVG